MPTVSFKRNTSVYKETTKKLADIALTKSSKIDFSGARYFTLCVVGGLFIGFGVMLSNIVGGYLDMINPNLAPIGAGIVFGVGLAYVFLGGAELITSNVFIMAIGTLEKKTTLIDSIKVVLYSFVGNFVGGIIFAVLLSKSGIVTGSMQSHILKVASAKMSESFIQTIIKGIICNIIICSTVWATYRVSVDDNTSKILMAFWCSFTFVASGLENSVANMTLLPTALMTINNSSISLSSFMYNITAATIGNCIGGIVFIALPYWYTTSDKAIKE